MLYYKSWLTFTFVPGGPFETWPQLSQTLYLSMFKYSVVSYTKVEPKS